ncbi:MAG: HAD family hydrolase [Methylophaga sp.]|nr:HAD family hydrolase [Methylophaga sp.]
MMSGDHYYALDFDGVICDSAIETGISGWKAAVKLWPDLPAQMSEQILFLFRQVRPAMETGYEAILICRALYDGIPVEQLTHSFADTMQQTLLRHGCEIKQLKTVFATIRDQWISDDFEGWLANNPLYPGIRELLLGIPQQQLFIVTTKQERFVSAILSANGITLDDRHIFGLEKQLRKPLILLKLQAVCQPKCLIFVEDRLNTLYEVIEDNLLEKVQLCLATWGYNTPNERQQAEQHHRIRIQNRPEDIILS